MPSDLTPERIDALAGCDLDAAVAEHVYGWLVVTNDGGEDWDDRLLTRWPCLVLEQYGGATLYEYDGDDGADWHPSGSWGQAMFAVEKMRADHPGWRFKLTWRPDGGAYAQVSVDPRTDPSGVCVATNDADARTAILRALLKAVTAAAGR